MDAQLLYYLTVINIIILASIVLLINVVSSQLKKFNRIKTTLQEEVRSLIMILKMNEQVRTVDMMRLNNMRELREYQNPKMGQLFLVESPSLGAKVYYYDGKDFNEFRQG